MSIDDRTVDVKCAAALDLNKGSEMHGLARIKGARCEEDRHTLVLKAALNGLHGFQARELWADWGAGARAFL